MLNTLGEVFAAGFVGGITTGAMVFLLNWGLSSAVNIFKFPMKGE